MNSNIINKLGSLLSFQKKATPAVAIDIEPTSIALLEFSKTRNHYTLQHHQLQMLEKDIYQKDELKDPSAFSRSLRQAINAAKINNQTASIAAPSGLVIVKQVSVDASLSPIQVESHAQTEANKAFPGIVDSLYLDFMVNKRDTKNATRSDMLLIAARKEELQPRLEAIQAAGLQVKIIDVDYYALARAYPLIAPQLAENHVEQNIALLNIETHHLLMTVMHKSDMTYCNHQAYNGEALTDLINQQINPTKKTTEEEAAPETSSPETLSKELSEQIGSQIKRSLQFHASAAPGKSISQIVLSGRCALIPTLSKAVEAATQIPTIIANPFTHVEIPPHIDKTLLDQQAPAYMISCGLAMHGMQK